MDTFRTQNWDCHFWQLLLLNIHVHITLWVLSGEFICQHKLQLYLITNWPPHKIMGFHRHNLQSRCYTIMITIHEKIPSVSVKMSEVSEPRDTKREHRCSVNNGLPAQKGEDNKNLPGHTTISGIRLNIPSLSINISCRQWPGTQTIS